MTKEEYLALLPYSFEAYVDGRWIIRPYSEEGSRLAKFEGDVRGKALDTGKVKTKRQYDGYGKYASSYTNFIVDEPFIVEHQGIQFRVSSGLGMLTLELL